MSAPPKVASHHRILSVALLFAVALAFVAGRWSAPPASAAGRDGRTEPRRGGAVIDLARAPLPTARRWAAPIAASPPPIAPPSPQLVAAVASEASVRFEQQRQAISAACWPAGGLRNGRTAASLRVNVTFDRDGREIARGIQEDRRASSSEFTRCLRSLEWTRLAVAPPGTNVGVTFPVHFP